MDSAKLNDWIQILISVGVILSLIFVGLQIRQEHTIAQAQNAAEFNDTMIEYSCVINANRDVWIKGLEGAELSAEDQVTFESVSFAVWQKFMGLYRRVRLLDQRSGMLAARQLAGELYIYPGLRKYVLARCRHRESIGQKISFCDDVRIQLKAFDNGTLPKPEGKLYVL